MAKDIRIIFTGDHSRADAAIKSLENSGKQAASILEREFNQLGINSALSFDNQRKAATAAYDKIKSSGLATADELERSQKAHAAAMTRIDEAEHGKRISLHEKLKTNWLAITASVAAAWATASKAITLAQEGAAFSQQGTSFANLAAASGASADKMIADLRRVSGETVSVQQLVEKAGSAMLLGVETKMIPKLMEIAKASSRITGQTVTEAFGDISLGMARQSKLILDNLGIMVDVDKANKDYAKSLGKTSEQLSDLERKQSFANAVLSAGQEIIEKVGKQAETEADKFAKFSSSIDNIGKSLGILLSGPMADVAGEMAATVGWLEAYKSGQVGFWEYLTTGADAAAEKLKNLRTTNFDASATPEGMDFARRKVEADLLKKDAEALAKSYEDLGIKTSASYAGQRDAALNAYNTIKNSGKATADELLRAEKAYQEKLKSIKAEERGITEGQEKAAREKTLEEIRKHNDRILDVEKKRIGQSREQEEKHLKKMTDGYTAAVAAMDSLIDARKTVQEQLNSRNAADLAKKAPTRDPLNTYLDQQEAIKRAEEQISNSFGMSAEEKAKKYADLIDKAAGYNQAVLDGSAEIVSAYQTEADYQASKERLQQRINDTLDSEAGKRTAAAENFATQMIASESRAASFRTEIENIESVLDRMNNKEINIIFKAQNAGQILAAGGVSGLETTSLPTTTFHAGTSYVPRSGLYPLARGEQILNRNEATAARAGGSPTINFGGINVTVDGSGKSGTQIGDEIGEAAARKLYSKFREFDKRYRA